MAIFHYHIQSIGRNVSSGKGVISAGANIGNKEWSGDGLTHVEGVMKANKSSKGSSSKIKPNRSAVACAAYRSATDLVEKIYDKESGLWFEKAHNYSHKNGVVFSHIFAPDDAAAWMLDRSELWNRIQNKFDTAKNSVFAKEMDVALPRELSVEQNIDLISEFVEDVLVSQGLVVDVNFHNDNEDNPHMHIMTSTRHIIASEDGSSTFGNKIREIDNKSFLHYLRASWASYTNKHLERFGFTERVDHRSYKDRGIVIVPTIHEGVGRHVENSDRACINREIMNTRATGIVANPEQVSQLLGISRAYFTPAQLEEKIASLILDDSMLDDVVIADRLGEEIGSISSPTALEKFRVDNDGNIILDSDGYSKFTEVRGSILSSVLGSDLIVKLEGLSELGEYYTTSARVGEEERFLDLARGIVDLKSDSSSPNSSLFRVLSESEVRSLASFDVVQKITKTPEQQFVVRGLIESGSLVQLYGYAGTGKSTVLSSVRDIYAGRGVDVLGIAPTAKSRGVLTDLGIESQTLHALKARHEWVDGILIKMEAGDFDSCSEWEMSFARNYKSPFNTNTVFMLDEASMVDLGIYSWLMEKCLVSGAKLISIGDYNQLPVVKGIGGGYRALIDNFKDKTFSLTEIWRQRDPVYKEITTHLANYRVSEALVLLKDKKPEVCKFIDGDRRDVELRLVGDYVSWFKEQNSLRDRVREGALSSTVGVVKYEVGSHLGYAMDGGFIDVSKSGVIISYLREDIARLNRLVREGLYLSGVLENKIFSEKRGFAADILSDRDVGTIVARGDSKLEPISLLLGEQIMFLKNDKRVRLYNGELATILDIRESHKASEDNNKASSHDILVRIHGKNSQRIMWFNSGDYGHFDYGYASTVHKVQGSSYDKIFFDFSKYIGFESFYVGVTRHIQDLSIYFNKAELVSMLHHRYGVDSANRSNGSISLAGSGGDDRNLYFAALETHVSRRSSDIFVSKFTGCGRGLEVSESQGSGRAVSKTESIFAEYYSVRNDAASLYREMLVEVSSSRIKKVAYHSRWDEFKDLTSRRGELAKVIISDIGDFESCLKITKANMSVIRDHAGMSGFGVEKIYGKVSSNRIGLNSVGSNINISEVSFAQRSDILSEYRNICDMHMDILYRGKDGSTHRDVVLANLISEASGFASNQRSIAHEIESFNANRENLTEQLRIVSQDIEVSSSRISNIAEGISKIYVTDPKIVVNNFSEYLMESGISLDELSIALKDDKISDNVRRLELHKVDLSKFGEIKGREYDLGLFKLSGFDKRQSLGNREFVVNNIVEYLNSERDFGVLLEKKTLTDSKLMNLMSHYDKDMEIRESKFLGYASLNHLEKIASNVDVVSLGKWLESSEAVKLGFAGYELIRREGAVSGGDEKEDRSLCSDLFLNRSEIMELKQSLLSRMEPITIARFFESHRGDIGAGDQIIIRSGVLKCGSFHLNLSGEKAGQWYRFSRSEGGDIYRLAQVLGAHGSGGEWNNFKVVASFAGINTEKIIDRVAIDISDSNLVVPRLFTEILKEIQNMKVENISGLGSNYVRSYQDKWLSLARVPSDALKFDLIGDAAYLVRGRVLHTGVYDYKDINGNLVGHMVRVENGDGSKGVYPISYCVNSETGECAWRVKGFAEGNLIYGADKLRTAQNKPVLIVEGEKTCEASRVLVGDEYAVISWSGGSSGVSKVDWSALSARDIVIWPDADVAGIKAAKSIERCISSNNIEVNNIKIIDVRSLGLDHGWDLADALPDHLKKFSVSDIIADSGPAIDDRRLELESRIGAITWNADATESEKSLVLEAMATSKLQEADLWNEEYMARLVHELSVIERRGASEEFRLAANIIKYCRSENIPVGFGRGSAVGSLTAHALGIYNVDPVKYDLSFDRFLSEGKASNPDFDIDVSAKDREKVVDYLFESMGKRAVLMSAIDGKRHPSAIAIIPEGMIKQEALESGIARFDIDEKSQRDIMYLSSDIRFKDLEAKGFRKIDLLSSQMLDKTYYALSEINQKYGVNLGIDEVFSAARIDKETYSLLSNGDTEGIFQLESNSARDICKSIKPKDFGDIINIIALNRPGSKKFVELFEDKNIISRNKENDNLKVFDPKGVFESTKGAILFQEQIMEAGIKYFGVEQRDADGFRRDLENAREDRTVADREECINRAVELNQDFAVEDLSNLYDSLEKFAEYGFNKSHAVAYAKHTLVTAYLKTHYREEFCESFSISGDTKIMGKKQKDKEAIGASITWNYNNDFMKEVDRLAPQVVRSWKININSSADVGQMIKAAKSVVLEDHFFGKLNKVGDMSIIQKSMLSHIEGMTRLQNSGYSDLIDVKGAALGEDMEDNYTNKASEKMEIEIKAEIISKISAGLGRYKEKEYGGSSDDDLYKLAKELYNNRKERIEYALKHNPIVMEFGKSDGLDAAKYFATQIVDYKMQQDTRDTGAWKNMLTERRLEIMKNVSHQQALFDKQLDAVLQGASSSINNNGGKEQILTPEIISVDQLAMREIAQLRLCRDMTMKMQEMGIDNLDVATAQKMRNENIIESTKLLENLQSSYKAERKEEMEENKERQISKDHGHGMEM